MPLTIVQVHVAVLDTVVHKLLHLLSLHSCPVASLSQHFLQVGLGGGLGVAWEAIAGEEGLDPDGIALHQLACYIKTEIKMRCLVVWLCNGTSDTLGPAILSSVERLFLGGSLLLRGQEQCPLLGSCPFLGGSFTVKCTEITGLQHVFNWTLHNIIRFGCGCQENKQARN